MFKKFALSFLIWLATALPVLADGTVQNVGHLGDYPVGQGIHFTFTSYTQSTGVPATLADNTCTGSVPHVVRYQDNSTTESEGGITPTPNFDSVTGLNAVDIDTSGFARASYTLVISCGKVGTTVAGYTVGSFTVDVGVNVRFINSADTTANSATLKLKSLDIQNNSGSAIIAKSSGSDGKGLDVAGNGTGAGLKIVGGAAADGVTVTPGSGAGINITAGGLSGSQLAIPFGLQYDSFMFKLVASTDNKTPKTGATVTAKISQDGAAFVDLDTTGGAGSISEVANGWYVINAITALDMSAAEIVLRFTAVGANTAEFKIHTNP